MFRIRSETRKNNTRSVTHAPSIENESVKSPESAEPVKSAKPAETKQKRNHFRLDCEIPAIIKLIHKNQSSQIALGEPNPALITNLSGGGVKLMATITLKEKERILVTFTLDDELIVMTSIVKFKTKTHRPDYPYQYGVMFTGTGTKDRDLICRHLFKEQMNSFS